MTDPRIDRIAARQHAQTAAARMTITPLIEDATDTQAESLAALFDKFNPYGYKYAVGDIVTADGILYRCVQGHVTQDDWAPDVTPGLWTPARKTTGAQPDEWKQPAGAHDAYNTGDRVTFEGIVWESVIDANVWSPTAHPAGWKKV